MTDLESRLRVALSVCIFLLAAVLLLRLLLPWLLLLGGVALVYGLWQHRYQSQRQRQNHLNQIFYHLVQHQQGRVSVLDFAMQAQLSGPEARHYLDQQAQAFSAQFEPTPQGDVLYVFSLGRF